MNYYAASVALLWTTAMRCAAAATNAWPRTRSQWVLAAGAASLETCPCTLCASVRAMPLPGAR